MCRSPHHVVLHARALELYRLHCLRPERPSLHRVGSPLCEHARSRSSSCTQRWLRSGRRQRQCHGCLQPAWRGAGQGKKQVGESRRRRKRPSDALATDSSPFYPLPLYLLACCCLRVFLHLPCRCVLLSYSVSLLYSYLSHLSHCSAHKVLPQHPTPATCQYTQSSIHSLAHSFFY